MEIYGQRSLVRFFGAPWTLLVRVPLLINFVLLLALLSPLGSSRKLYKAERAAGIAASITLTLQVWVIGTTLFATASSFGHESKGLTRLRAKGGNPRNSIGDCCCSGGS
jgi:hypothetical protein